MSFHVTVIDWSTRVIALILVTLILMRAGSVIRYKYKQRSRAGSDATVTVRERMYVKPSKQGIQIQIYIYIYVPDKLSRIEMR